MRRRTILLGIGLSALVLVLAVSFFLRRDSAEPEAAACIEGRIEALFVWKNRTTDVRILDLKVDGRDPNPPLRTALENEVREEAIRFVQRTELSHGKGKLIGRAIGCGEPYLVTFYEREAIEPDVRFFMRSVIEGDPETVKTMLSSGFEVNTRQWSGGTTALMYAAESRNPEMTLVLLNAGANPNLKDDEGITALMVASSRGNAKIVRVLLNAGADANAKSATGETALSLAKKFEHPQVVDMLKKAGALE